MSDQEPRWRVGRKVGRTVYLDEALVGCLDTPEIAADAVNALNDVPDLRAAATDVANLFLLGDHDCGPEVDKAIDALRDLLVRQATKP